jgi:hypothetical protein
MIFRLAARAVLKLVATITAHSSGLYVAWFAIGCAALMAFRLYPIGFLALKLCLIKIPSRLLKAAWDSLTRLAMVNQPDV